MQLTRGDTGRFKFQRIDDEGQPITTIPDAIYFTVKKSYQSSSVILQKTLADMELDQDGTFHFVIDPTDTETLPYGHYVFDIEVTDSDYVQTIAKGAFVLLEESTWSDDK